MRTQQFLEHHGVGCNPFAEEDAQTDPVFKEHCIASTYHPTWDKIYGDPVRSGHLDRVRRKRLGQDGLAAADRAAPGAATIAQHPRQRVFVIEYDDFNPFLDRFRDRLSSRRQASERVLAEWKLWDHMDAILSLGVTATGRRHRRSAPTRGGWKLAIRNRSKEQQKHNVLLIGFKKTLIRNF